MKKPSIQNFTIIIDTREQRPFDFYYQTPNQPVVILPVHSSFAYSYNRALLYISAIRQAIKDVKVYNRKTILVEKIENRILGDL